MFFSCLTLFPYKYIHLSIKVYSLFSAGFSSFTSLGGIAVVVVADLVTRVAVAEVGFALLASLAADVVLAGLAPGVAVLLATP